MNINEYELEREASAPIDMLESYFSALGWAFERNGEDEIVSSDIVSDPASCTFDSSLTMVQEGNTVKILGWYDNEWGYSNRLVDLTVFVGGQL